MQTVFVMLRNISEMAGLKVHMNTDVCCVRQSVLVTIKIQGLYNMRPSVRFLSIIIRVHSGLLNNLMVAVFKVHLEFADRVNMLDHILVNNMNS